MQSLEMIIAFMLVCLSCMVPVVSIPAPANPICTSGTELEREEHATAVQLQTELLQTQGTLQELAADEISTSSSTVRDCVNDYAEALDQVQSGLGSNIRSHPLTSVATSDRDIVLAPSFGGTATISLFAALTDLGKHGSHYPWSFGLDHVSETCDWIYDLDVTFKTPHVGGRNQSWTVNYTSLPATVEAIVERPLGPLFIDFFLSFPNAKWILSKRDGLEQVESRLDEWGPTIFRGYPPLPNSICESYDNLDFAESKESLARLQDLNYEFIECVVPPERLFAYDLFADGSDGLLHKMGNFLGTPVLADAEFPHTVHGLEMLTLGWEVCSSS